MKKNYIYECCHCGFQTNEKNKKCPLCENETKKIVHEKLDNVLNLPEKLEANSNRKVKVSYYCFKCRKESINKVCMDCNNVSSLMIEYNNKKAIIKRIDRLSDVFTPNEIDEILSELTIEEKNLIYLNYESAYRFFYKKDKPKAITCFIFAFIFYFLFLDIALNMSEQSIYFMSYFFNVIANFIFAIMILLGIWYLTNATVVEFDKVPAKLAIVISIPNIINLAYLIIMDCKIKEILISGWITLIFSFILYVIYILVAKHYEK